MHKPIKFLYALLIITIIGGGVTFGILKDANKKAEAILISSDTPTAKLPTEFRTPTPDGAPHIVDAEIERITIPGCKNCSVDIIKSAQGVSDKNIIDINDRITYGLFKDGTEDNMHAVDIRDPKHRKLATNVSVDNFEDKILYVDKGLVETYVSMNIYHNGDASPYSVSGSYDTYYLDNNDEIIFFTDYATSNDVLDHFYPNGGKLFAEYVKESEGFNTYECAYGSDFPNQFLPKLRPNTGEVVFTLQLPHDCDPVDLEVAIPIADILREVPQFVPKDSVLWRFK